ncbi:FkbM family methyltransferase [Sphingomonas sp. So64.6b]|uniref:FkbM family methyltransferase n=1 Tax=Sphingomonas sp. So64.6b TaxID=2997354 RepID=UPI001603D946|nr:FkbM family methyltransferase [Sphingomonas sp. So64.6b]QNA83253.1 FkbM family methyltransferase [Sphingomonas sp. So64.6b]
MSDLVGYALDHPLGRRAPIRTLSRIARWQIESRLKPGIHDKSWIEGARLLIERGMTGATGNLYFGLHEFADMGFLLHFLRVGDLLVDVGANVGSYTVLAARVVGADVIAIEPHPATADRLDANIEHNAIGAKVSVQRVALSDAAGTGTLTGDRDTMNQLVDHAGAGTVAVALTTLDMAVGKADPIMLKIDVEGHEPAVFAGAAATLAKPSLLAIEIETVDPAILAQLSAAGFVERFYDPFKRALTTASSGSGASNRLFVRNTDVVEKRVVSARRFSVAGTAL